MGHNDESDPSKNDKYSDRGTLPGLGEESKVVTGENGKPTKVYTFGYYLRVLIANVTALDATPTLSGMVPRNYWKNDALQTVWPMADYAQQQAQRSKIEYLDHTKYSVRAFQKMGKKRADALYPNDRTHTGDEGARINAETFIEAIKCGKSQLAKHLNDKGQAVKTSC